MNTTLVKVSPKEVYKLRKLMANAYGDYSQSLMVRADYKLRNRAVSEDLVQTTFLKTWLYLIRGGKIETMRAFLYHVLNLLIIDEYRKRSNSSLEYLMENGFNPASDVLERDMNFLEGKEVVALITKLSPKYQQIITMRYVQGLTLEEMSLVTGQSKNAVAVQAHRGLEELRNLHLHTTQASTKQ
jgi:RNA polymerase sigma-70 factor, ECF subfamily